MLSIACARLGADEVVALEGDPLACEALVENVTRNGVADRVQIVERWVDATSLSALGPGSGIVANLERRILQRLLSGLIRALGDDGWMILSGVPAVEWAEFERDLGRRGLRAVRRDTDDGWRSALFRLRA